MRLPRPHFPAGPRAGRQPLTAELRFGSDLSLEAVEATLTAISGLPRRSTVVLETLATEDGIRHLVHAEQSAIDSLRSQLRGLIPTTRLDTITPEPAPEWRLGARIGWPGPHPLLRSDSATPTAAAMLGALGVLGHGEAVLLRVALRPGRAQRVAQPRTERKPQGALERLFASPQVGSHEVSAIRAKQAGPLLDARVLVAVASTSKGRAAHLLSRSVGVYRTRRGARGGFAVRPLRGRTLSNAVSRGLRSGSTLSPGELSGLIGWPIGAPRIPGLSLGSAPLLVPDRRLPGSGRVIGRSSWPGMEQRLLAQPVEGALSHSLIVGPTGVGKSNLLINLITADIAEGRGVLVIDGKGDLASDLLARIAPSRVDDVIVLDPAAGGPVSGLRVFAHGDDPELAADVVLGVLRDLFRDHWGVRSDQWLRAGLVTLGHDPTATLGDLPFLFSDDTYRRRLVGKLSDPLLAATWAAYEAMSPGERSNQLGAPLTKLSELLGRRVLRSVLSQPSGTLDMREVLREGRIVIVSLNPGRLGSPAARLLGALVMHALFSAVQARTTISPGRRTPFLAYVDEPKVLGDIPVPLDSMFELARGMGVGLTISAQALGQLPDRVRTAALTNAASLVAFRQTADDAALLARDLSGVSAEQLQSLGRFEIVARIGLRAGEIATPVTAHTLPASAPISDPERVRETSAQRYGQDPAAVDRALAARHGHQSPPAGSDDLSQGVIGRARRKK